MCWNQHVSLNTFIFSLFVLLLIAYNNAYTQYKMPEFNNIYVYLFFLSFISIQLIEFFIWRNINDKSLNQFFSIAGMLLVTVQPIISLMMLKDETIKKFEEDNYKLRMEKDKLVKNNNELKKELGKILKENNNLIEDMKNMSNENNKMIKDNKNY